MAPRSRIAREDGLAGQAGQHQVEDDQVDRFGVEGGDRRVPVADDGDGMPVALEVEPQQVGETRFVLDDQDPGAGDHATHRSPTPVKES